MAERKIGDPELQELLNKNHVTVDITQRPGRFPNINFRFPTLDELAAESRICEGCGKLAIVTPRTTSHPFRRKGVVANFCGLRLYQVKGCQLEDMDKKTFDRFSDLYAEGADVAKIGILIDRCLQNKTVPGLDQRTIVERTLAFIHQRFSDLKPRILSEAEILASLGERG